jgi:acetyltransferase-like isoleucine patch superfamily enzyme
METAQRDLDRMNQISANQSRDFDHKLSNKCVENTKADTIFVGAPYSSANQTKDKRLASRENYQFKGDAQLPTVMKCFYIIMLNLSENWFKEILSHVMQSIYRTLGSGPAAFKRRRARKIFLRKCQERNSRIESSTIYPENYNNLHVGSNVVAYDTYFDTSGEITIGDATFFGWGVKVLTGTHPIYEKGIARQMTLFKPVFIGPGVWVASYAIILPGAVIGEDSVVSAGSVVRGVFPSGQLISGNPAKTVKSIDFSQSEATASERLA